MNITEKLQAALNKRKDAGSFRQLKVLHDKVDACSNDYLGLARDPLLHDNILKAAAALRKTGSTGSRLLTGNNSLIEKLEKDIAAFHGAESALFFNSGYEANAGLIAAVAGRNDTIVYDALCHASLREGIRLSNATAFSFAHNDLTEMELMLQKATGNIFVVVESVYSMDGDAAPLPSIIEIAERYGAAVILDEAHATGVLGDYGEGLAQQCQLQDRLFARVHTFGKAMGSNGAVVLGSNILRDFLINFCRPFIYTTAPNYLQILAVQEAYALLKKEPERVKILSDRIGHFKSQLRKFPHLQVLPTDSAIFSVVIPGNEDAKLAATYLQNGGYDVRAVLSPTVPEGKERLRICMHSFNTELEIDRLVKLLDQIDTFIRSERENKNEA